MNKKKKKTSIILQVAVLFIIGIAAIGILTYVSQFLMAENNVREQSEGFAASVSEEVRASVKEYPAYEWLLSYWYRHADDLEIEYDVDYKQDTETAEKCRVFNERHPDIQLKYVTAKELETLPEEDQKLYAEITYSWLITRVNQIKRTYHVDYLFCVLTDTSYKTQFFLFSAAEANSVRGTDYEEVYTLGTQVTVSDSQRKAMSRVLQNDSYLAEAGEYMDYYVFLTAVDKQPVLIGITYNTSELGESIGVLTKQGTINAILSLIALSLVCLFLLFLVILRPLKKVQESIRLYKETKNSQTVVENLSRVRSGNEIAQLSEDVAGLAKEIDDYVEKIETITSEKERISTELSLASRIQASMLPSVFPAFPERKEFEIYASMTPAKEVGGDFYDFFLIDEDHLFMTIADISGKGVPAALFMMASRIVLANFAMMGKSPAEILEDTNTSICSNNKEEMFLTAWLGILEISTGRLTASNAGHEYPIITDAAGRFELLRDRHGLVIGGMEDARYLEYELQLKPGSKIFLYTDGVPEATDVENHMFGTKRMIQTLNETPDSAPKILLENMQRAVDEFVKDAEQFDDLTMMCLSYNGSVAAVRD